MKKLFFRWAAVVVAVWAAGCATSPDQGAQRLSKARFEYNRIMREFRVPAEEATNDVQRLAMLEQAAVEYLQFTQNYGDCAPLAAAALRSLGQIHLALGEGKEALSCFEQVGQRYPQEHWEVIQAWKQAADTLWETRHRGEATLYYQQIVTTYDRPGQPPMFETVVNIARSRLKERGVP